MTISTQTEVNKLLAKGSQPLTRISWDQNDPETQSGLTFDVIFGDEYAPFRVIDNGDWFELIEIDEDGPCITAQVSGYHRLADLLAEVVAEAIAADLIFVPEQEA